MQKPKLLPREREMRSGNAHAKPKLEEKKFVRQIEPFNHAFQNCNIMNIEKLPHSTFLV